jgi:hypothetical protein
MRDERRGETPLEGEVREFHSPEKQVTRATPTPAKGSKTPLQVAAGRQLQDAVRHLKETEGQVKRLQEVARLLETKRLGVMRTDWRPPRRDEGKDWRRNGRKTHLTLESAEAEPRVDPNTTAGYPTPMSSVDRVPPTEIPTEAVLAPRQPRERSHMAVVSSSTWDVAPPGELMEIPAIPETASSRATWAVMIAAGFVLATVLILPPVLGTRAGLSAVPVPPTGGASATISNQAIGWLIAAQIVAYAIVGYIAGRLRPRWGGQADDAGTESSPADSLPRPGPVSRAWRGSSLGPRTSKRASSDSTDGQVD